VVSIAGTAAPVTGEPFEQAWGAVRAQVSARCRQLAGDAHEAEDLYQRVAIRAWRGHAAFRGDSSYLTWVARITEREAIRLAQRRQADRQRLIPLDTAGPAAEPAAPEPAFGGPDAGWAPDAAWVRGAVDAAAAAGAVSPAEHEVLRARLAAPGDSWAAVAAGLGLTPSGCAVTHCRAVPKLRVFLFTSRPALIGGAGAIAVAFERARHDSRAPLTGLEAEAFEQLVIRRAAYRRRGSRAALRGACAKVAGHLGVP
jgi:DNA-directed RNA polymerase specialized sigma24 family protein